jgi:ParB family transcriptional regulator, chromosome partitioning protein
MKRKDTLRALLTPEPQPAEAAAPAQQRVPAGAVRAMGLALGRLRDEAAEAMEMKARMEAGGAIAELDPELVDPSFLPDRLSPEDDTEFRLLMQSIAGSGQQVPVLVRPHPDQPGRYQLAYGHRRLRAIRELGLKLKAIVKALTDAELAIAQGKENLERRDLTFIERAMFALQLEAAGFDRPTLHAALAVQSAEMTRYLTVARAVPSAIVHAIGPAPRTGRPRWMELARLLASPEARQQAANLIASPDFRALNSDARFARVLNALQKATTIVQDQTEWWHGPGQVPIVRIERSGTGTRLTVNETAAPGFGAFLIARLEELHAAYKAEQVEE